jgi:hypothetical protein
LSAPIDCRRLADLVSRFSLVEQCDTVRNGMLRLATPFRYPDGSSIDLFLTPEPDAAGQLTLTDLGHTTAYLLDFGVRPAGTKKRQIQWADICQSLGVIRDGGELKIHFDAAHAPSVATLLVRLAQACLRTADMALTQRTPVVDTFGEDFEEFVTEIDRPYETGVELIGRYQKPVPVDYRVRGQATVSLVQTVSTANAAAAHGLCNEIFRRWYDLEPEQPRHTFVTVYDTTNNAIREDDLRRLGEKSLVLGYPAQAPQLTDVLAA